MDKILPPPEVELLAPVLRLFPKARYYRYIEAPLGRRKIDLLCLPKNEGNDFVCIELKISDWKRALWQAIVNFQIAEQSYIALWHSFVCRAKKNLYLFEKYGIGLISVDSKSAEIIHPSRDTVTRIARNHRRSHFGNLAVQV